MKNIKQLTTNLIKLTSLMVLIVAFSQCRKDEDENFRIRIENHCDFAIKVYYDNQDIEYYEDDIDNVSVVGAVTFIPPFQDKIVYSKYSSVWVEPEIIQFRARKFRSYNDGPWRKKVIINESDFY